jgi:hypothetical protein
MSYEEAVNVSLMLTKNKISILSKILSNSIHDAIDHNDLIDIESQFQKASSESLTKLKSQKNPISKLKSPYKRCQLSLTVQIDEDFRRWAKEARQVSAENISLNDPVKAAHYVFSQLTDEERYKYIMAVKNKSLN